MNIRTKAWIWAGTLGVFGGCDSGGGNHQDVGYGNGSDTGENGAQESDQAAPQEDSDDAEYVSPWLAIPEPECVADPQQWSWPTTEDFQYTVIMDQITLVDGDGSYVCFDITGGVSPKPDGKPDNQFGKTGVVALFLPLMNENLTASINEGRLLMGGELYDPAGKGSLNRLNDGEVGFRLYSGQDGDSDPANNVGGEGVMTASCSSWDQSCLGSTRVDVFPSKIIDGELSGISNNFLLMLPLSTGVVLEIGIQRVMMKANVVDSDVDDGAGSKKPQLMMGVLTGAISGDEASKAIATARQACDDLEQAGTPDKACDFVDTLEGVLGDSIVYDTDLSGDGVIEDGNPEDGFSLCATFSAVPVVIAGVHSQAGICSVE